MASSIRLRSPFDLLFRVLAQLYIDIYSGVMIFTSWVFLDALVGLLLLF